LSRDFLSPTIFVELLSRSPLSPMRDLKDEATAIFLESLKRVQLDSAIDQRLRLDDDQLFVDGKLIDLRSYREVVLIALGKASESMGAAIEAVLGDRLSRGILVTNRKARVETKSELIVAGHPLPDKNSLKAAERIIQLIESCGTDSLIIFAVSGGGSSLVELPLSSAVTLEDLRELNRLLIGSGATIRDINIVRKHLSRVKGGRLGYLARHSQIVALFVSDVNPGDLKSIASNPLLPDDSTCDEFLDIVNRYGLMEKMPQSIKSLIDSGLALDLPREWRTEGGKQHSVLLLENADALVAAGKAAQARGYRVEIDRTHSEAEYEGVADALIDKLLAMREAESSELVCLISGGEVSCSVSGRGFGGRNQEFVLYCAARLAACGFSGRIAVLSCGTDGIDGNSSAAGAVGSADVIRSGANVSLDASSFIAENNSTSFFCEAGGLIVTGPTGNNVRDLRILLAD
jgi:glycerate 2-kinase